MSEWKTVEDASLLKEGDRVRLTLDLEIRDKDASSSGARVWTDGRAYWFSSDLLNAGKLERQERPLGVGDRVKYAGNPASTHGAILHVIDERAWVRWDRYQTYDDVVLIAQLERVEQ